MSSQIKHTHTVIKIHPLAITEICENHNYLKNDLLVFIYDLLGTTTK